MASEGVVSGKRTAPRPASTAAKAAAKSVARQGVGRGTSRRTSAKSGTVAAKASRSERIVSAQAATSTRSGGSTTKISVTVPSEVLAEVRGLGPDNLSGVVADALRQWSATARLRRLLDELDEVYGPVPAEVAAEVEAEWGPIFDRSAAHRAEEPTA